MSGQPYTFATHAAFCVSESNAGRMVPGRHVQVLKRGVNYCARIANLWTAPGGVDCWTVETLIPEVARFTVPVNRVRLCAGIGCMCEAVK